MADRVIFVCTLLLAGGYFYATEQLPTLEIGDPLGPKAFPRLLTIALVLTAIVLLFEMVKGRKPIESDVPRAEEGGGAAYWIIAGVVAVTAVYFWVFEALGFIVATSLYLIVLTSYFHRGKWFTNVVTSVLFSVGTYWLFQVLGVSLARGILPF
jgi:putative tricarboxylic transport membrane protein